MCKPISDHYKTINVCQVLTSKQYFGLTLQASIWQKKSLAKICKYLLECVLIIRAQ